MLPYEEWDSYYDRPCEVCEETIRWRHEEFADCTFCNRLMCEECTYQECHVCTDDKDGYEKPPERGTTCGDCMAYCEKCDVKLHPFSCLKEHKKCCNPKDRACRAVKEAQEELNRVKNQLSVLQKQRESAEVSLTRAKANLCRCTNKK